MTIRFAHSFPEDCPLDLEGPVVSIYFKTHRLSSEAKIDQKTFKNLVKEARNKLEDVTDSKTIKIILEPLEALLIEPSFWIYNQEGCAIFANKNEAVVYRLFEPVAEKVIVASSIYIKPLVRLHQLKHHYFIIGLTRENFEVFEVLDEKISLFTMDKSVLKTADEVLGTEKTEAYLSAGNYTHVSNRGMFHGHGGQKKENDIDAERFFRYVDKTVSETITDIQSLPIVLCALQQTQQVYRNLAKDVNLISNPIETTFESLSIEQLKEKGDEIIKGHQQSVFNSLKKQGLVAISSDRYSTQITDIIKAINNSKIEQLFIVENKTLEGTIDWENNKYSKEENQNDIYDDCAEACIKHKVPVYILPEAFMPTTAPIFAIINP
jgi:hypothetical protein